jgi:hypothetical protein
MITLQRLLTLSLLLAPALALADDDPPPADPRKVTAAYRQWTYTSCEHRSSCSNDLARLAGIRVYDPYMTNPRDNTPNPDPTWLPGWERLPTGQQSANATDALVALHLAAERRTWAAACDARYPKVKEDADAREVTARAAIEAAAKLPPYERIAALLANPLRGRTGAPAFTEGNDGAAFAVEVAIVEAFRAMGRDDVYAAAQVGFKHEATPRWDAALEHDAFCELAMRSGDPTAPKGTALPALPTYYDQTRAAAAVKPVISAERATALATADAARKDAAKAALATAKSALPMLASPGEIKSFKRAGGKAIITLAHHSAYAVGFDRCVNGYGLRVPCPTTAVVEDTATTITFADWPADLTLAKGDTFTFYGNETKRDRKGSNTKVKWTVTVDGLFLIEATHAGVPRSFLKPTPAA